MKLQNSSLSLSFSSDYQRVPACMRSRIPTRWMVVTFVLLGVLVALVLIVRGLGDESDVTEEDGTAPARTQ